MFLEQACVIQYELVVISFAVPYCNHYLSLIIVPPTCLRCTCSSDRASRPFSGQMYFSFLCLEWYFSLDCLHWKLWFVVISSCLWCWIGVVWFFELESLGEFSFAISLSNASVLAPTILKQIAFECIEMHCGSARLLRRFIHHFEASDFSFGIF